jgi:cysteine desulfurase/selenocysteine lyase
MEPIATFSALDIQQIRSDFPILHQSLNGKPLVYFDNAATTQKPKQVIEKLSYYYNTINANIHRGIHTLAEKATAEYEATRESVRSFINAKETAEIIFTQGTTQSLNLVASSLGRYALKAGDEILITTMEHHSNIVPWQMIAELTGAILKVIPINEKGEILIEEGLAMLTERTKILSMVYVSNALGTINPVKTFIEKAKTTGTYTVIDGAQASSHLDIDVQALDCDFLALSAHKMYGPTGVGILYGKRAILEAIPPYQGGGEMIKDVSFEVTTYNELPYKFEAGTPNIADTIAFKEAIDYINHYGKAEMAQWENELLSYATEKLTAEIEGFRPIGTADNKISVISFLVEGVHHHDIGLMLDHEGIAIRTGHHCTQPLMSRLQIPGTNRVSFAVYNTKEEIDYLTTSLKKVVKRLR